MKTLHNSPAQAQAITATTGSWSKCLHGKQPGVRVLVLAQISDTPFSAAEIIRRLNGIKSLKLSSGALFFHCFHDTISLAELAEFESSNGAFDIVIELRSTPLHLSHLPQVATSLADSTMQDIAHEFGAPVLINRHQVPDRLNDLSLSTQAKWLTYELGQSAQTNALSIWAGVKGLLNVMAYLGMIHCALSRVGTVEPFVAYINQWVRAEVSGIIRENENIALNANVEKGQILATIQESKTGEQFQIAAPTSGIIIGKQNSQFVCASAPLYHIASVVNSVVPQQQIANIQRGYYPEALVEAHQLHLPFS